MADAKSNNYNRSNVTLQPGHANHYSGQYVNMGKTGQGYGMPLNSDIASLAHTFQGMNIQTQAFANHAKNMMLPNIGTYNGNPHQPPIPYNSTAQYVYPSSYNTTAPQQPGMYTPHAPQYMPHIGHSGYQQHDISPISQNWTPTTSGHTGEIPTLITPRRDSVSSNENDQPATPAGGYGYAAYQQGAGIAVHRSPGTTFAHSTPSPINLSMAGVYGIQMGKHPEQSDLSPRIKMLITREPAIPPAIPAPSSPLKPLDRALENQRGETNVYVRGLLPETTDQMLELWGSRFGDIKSSKSIIDLQTGLCKGFGFVKYHNYEDAENCIRGFHHLGYEVSFARESFYSKLKTFSDEGNTNLYVSNLPKTMNEHELAQLFTPHKVCSSRILRDKNGNGRGVGFARFESRDVCQSVIKDFNNYTIPNTEEELQIQIRYADTQEQKSLKQQTQAARQFRSAEYEYATQAWRQTRLPHYAGDSVHVQQNANEFDHFLGTTPAVPIQGQRWASSAIRQIPGRSSLGEATYASAAPAPIVSINVCSGVASKSDGGRDSGSDTKPAAVNSSVAQANSPVDSVIQTSDVD